MIADTTLDDRRPRPAWVRGVCAALVMTVLYLGAVDTLGVLPAFLAPRHDHLARGILACLGMGVVTALTLAVSFEVLLANRLQDVRPFGIARPQHLWSTLGIGLAAYYPLSILGALISRALGLGGTTTPDLHNDNSGAKLVLSFLIIVVAPWLEEVSIRGVLFSSLEGRFGLLAGAFVSAFLWAALHRVAFVLVPFTMLGMLLALLRWRSRSVIPGILLHGTLNSVVTLAVTGAGWYMAPMPFVLLASVGGLWLWLPADRRLADPPVL